MAQVSARRLGPLFSRHVIGPNPGSAMFAIASGLKARSSNHRARPIARVEINGLPKFTADRLYPEAEQEVKVGQRFDLYVKVQGE